MAKVKYVIMEVSDGERIDVVPVVFPTALIHKEMYRAMRSSYAGILKNRNANLKFKAVSAGFVYFNYLESIKTEGRSDSLNIDSRIEDSKIIFDMLTKDRQIVYPPEEVKEVKISKSEINTVMRKF